MKELVLAALSVVSSFFIVFLLVAIGMRSQFKI